jgi:hypothetical protein
VSLTPQQIDGRLAASLSTIEDLWADMLAPPAKRPGSGTRGSGVLLPDDSESAADTPRLVDVVDHRHRIALVLNAWCRAVIEDHDVTHGIPHGLDVPGMVGFLRRWSHLMAEHEAAEVMLDELESCADTVRRYAEPQRRTWIALGPCPLVYTHPDTGDAQTCPGQVRSDEDDAEWATCNRCQTRAVASWWEREMFPGLELAEERALTTAEVVTLAHKQFGMMLTKQAVWQWVSRGELHPIDRDAKPHQFLMRHVVRSLARKAS